MLTNIGDDQLLSTQLVRLLHARGQHRVAFARVGADAQHKRRLRDVVDGPGVAAVAHRAEQALRGRRLAVARAVVDVVGADDCARQLLHQVVFFVGCLRRRDKTKRIRTVLGLDPAELGADQLDRFVPARLAKRGAVGVADQRLGQPVGRVHIIPAELSFHAGRNVVRGTLARLHLENVPVLGTCPDIERAAHAAVGAHRLGDRVAGFAHGGFGLRDLQNGPVTHLRLDRFHQVDQLLERLRGPAGHIAGLPDHGFFHQRIARAYRDAVAAADARGARDGVPAIPLHARVLAFPVDRQRFIHLVVLAGLHAAPAQDALVRVVAVERVGLIFLVGLRAIRVLLVLYLQQPGGVVHGAVAVVVIADRAVQQVVGEDPVKALRLRLSRARAFGHNHRSGFHPGGAGPLERTVDLDKAGVAGLDGPQLLEIADVRHLALGPAQGALQGVDQQLSGQCFRRHAVHADGAFVAMVRACGTGEGQQLRRVGARCRFHKVLLLRCHSGRSGGIQLSRPAQTRPGCAS